MVEDWLMVAQEIELILRELGCEVVGPAPRLDRAIDLARSESIDVAILDVNLDNEEVYPVADELIVRGVPFLFLTGYDGHTLPPEFKKWPRLEKPFAAKELSRELRRLIQQPDAAE